LKLLSCHIENFGKIQNLSVDFSDGMHVINEPNAWGKSTLAAFIKVMFYGFDQKKEAGTFDKERTVYRPWQGGTYGGELEFEAGGQTYRISRTFGKSEKQDEFHLYDCVTNLECNDFSEDIGEELFDLDAASFKRSIYIMQNDCGSRTTDAINAKLGNLVENTNDINNYESAQEYLKDLANKLSPNRATGSIKKRRNQIAAVEQELHSYEAADQAITELGQKQQLALFNKESLMRQRESYAEQLKEASEESRKKELRKNYLGLCEEQQNKLSALLPYTDIFPMGVPDDDELSAQIVNARKLEEDRTTLLHMDLSDEERESYGKLKVKFRKSVPRDDQIEKQLAKLKKVQAIRDERMQLEMQLSEKEHESLLLKAPEMEPTSGVTVRAVLGALLMIAGAAGEVFGILHLNTEQYGLALTLGSAFVFVFGILLLVLGFHKRAVKLEKFERERREWEERQRDWKNEVAKLQKEEKSKDSHIQSIHRDAEEFLRQYLVYTEVSEYVDSLHELKRQAHEYQRLCEKVQRYEEFREAVQEERNALVEYGSRIGQNFGDDITDRLTQLSTEAAKYRMAKENADAARARVQAFEKSNNMAYLLRENHMPFTLEQLNDKIKELDDELEEARDGIEQYSRQMEDLEEQLDLRDEKEDELTGLIEQSKKEQKIFDTVTITQDYLQKAREQFTARYMAPISNAFRKYYELLVGETDDKSWQIDANINFRVQEEGELRETKWLSSGYQDLIGVCMRLALVDAMYQGEKPFLILDDPFVNLDEEKTKRGMKLLAAVSGEYQVLYFTCHSSREPRQ
jgi:uncharacterized protein YhaN